MKRLNFYLLELLCDKVQKVNEQAVYLLVFIQTFHEIVNTRRDANRWRLINRKRVDKLGTLRWEDWKSVSCIWFQLPTKIFLMFFNAVPFSSSPAGKKGSWVSNHGKVSHQRYQYVSCNNVVRWRSSIWFRCCLSKWSACPKLHLMRRHYESKTATILAKGIGQELLPGIKAIFT